MAARRGNPLQGDRSAHDMTDGDLHASDIEDTTPLYHWTGTQLDARNDALYVRRDGTLGLSGHWDAGAFTITTDTLDADTAIKLGGTSINVGHTLTNVAYLDYANVFAAVNTFINSGLHILDTNASHDLIITPGSDLTADRILTLTTGDAARTLDLGGNLTIGATTSITGGGTVALGGFTLTVPATGTAALLATANVFTAVQKINVNSATAFLVEQTGVKNNVLVVDTANGRVGVGTAPVVQFHVAGNDFVPVTFESASNTSYYRPDITLVRSRGTMASKLTTIANDYNGVIQFRAHDGTDTVSVSAQIVALLDGAVSSNSTPGRLVFGTTPSGAAIATDRMIINSAGNVVIGGTTANARLHVKGTADDEQLIVQANATQTANIVEVRASGGGVLAKVTPTGGALFSDKVSFTQTDNNEYIDSLNDGYMDYGATTLHRFNNPLTIANIKSGATQVAAGAAANELWKTASHATLPDNVVMIGV